MAKTLESWCESDEHRLFDHFLDFNEWLADLMIEHNIGVSTVRAIELKRLDSDYFEE